MNVNAVIIVVVNSLVTVKIGMNTSITGLGSVANLLILEDEPLHDMTIVTLTNPILVPAASEIMRKKGYTTVTFNFNACHKILCFIPSKVSLIGQRHIQKYQAWGGFKLVTLDMKSSGDRVLLLQAELLPSTPLQAKEGSEYLASYVADVAAQHPSHKIHYECIYGTELLRQTF